MNARRFGIIGMFRIVRGIRSDVMIGEIGTTAFMDEFRCTSPIKGFFAESTKETNKGHCKFGYNADSPTGKSLPCLCSRSSRGAWLSRSRCAQAAEVRRLGPCSYPSLCVRLQEGPDHFESELSPSRIPKQENLAPKIETVGQIHLPLRSLTMSKAQRR